MPTCRRRKRLSAATTVAAASTLLAIAPLGTRGFTGLSLFSRLRATNSITGRLSSARSLRRLDLLGDISMRRSLPMTGASSEASGFHGRRVVSTCADDDNSGNGGLGGWGWAVSRRVRSRKACLMSMENSSGNEERRQQPKPSHNYGTPRGITGTGVDRGNAPDLPALVVGVGLLVARHRRQQRANHERRQFAKRGPLVTTEDEEDMAMSVPGMGLAGAGLASKRTPGGRKGAFRKVEDDDKDGSVSAFLEEADSYVAESELLEGKGRENKGNYGEEEYDETASQGELAEEEQQHSSRADMDSETASIFPSHGEVTALEVSLDRPVLPEPVGPFLVFGTATVTCLGGIAVLARIPRMFEGVSSALRSMASQTMNPSNSERKLVPVFGDLRYNARLWAGSMRAWGDQRVEAWRRTFASEEVRLPVNDWSVCTLVERNVVGGNVLRYRFRLEGSPDSVLPLELGQALTLCGLDSSNKVLHGSYVPLSPRRQRGYFDVVVKRGSKGIDDGLDTTRSDKAFSHFLDKLPIGDELAVRPGREGLVYRGPYSPITDLVLIATGLGVVPMIQMVKELLPSGDSSVSTASVIWLNEKAEDFVLYGELEKVFFRNHRKLDVTCIVERDLYGHQLAANPSVREAAPDFKIGTLAAIAGPEFFTRKVTDFLVHKGYPEEVIIQL